MPDETDDWRPFEPLGSDRTMNERRMASIAEDRKQTHALEHIAKVLDRIDAKLDRLIAGPNRADLG